MQPANLDRSDLLKKLMCYRLQITEMRTKDLFRTCAHVSAAFPSQAAGITSDSERRILSLTKFAGYSFAPTTLTKSSAPLTSLRYWLRGLTGHIPPGHIIFP